MIAVPGQLRADHPRGLQALGGLRRRHPDVDDSQVGPGRTDQGEQPGSVPRLAGDVEPGTVEQAGETFAQQDIVVGEHDPWCAPALRCRF